MANCLTLKRKKEQENRPESGENPHALVSVMAPMNGGHFSEESRFEPDILRD